MDWNKVGKHSHVSSCGKYRLIRRDGYGGHHWQIFTDDKPWAIVSEPTIGEAVARFAEWEKKNDNH